MPKNPNPLPSKTFIFVETKTQLNWAIDYFKRHQVKQFEKNILPIGHEAQVEFLLQGFSFDHYIDLQPSKKLKYKFYKNSSTLAFNWFRPAEISQPLTLNSINLGHYLVNYLTNFVPLAQISSFVLRKFIRKYKPDKIIYFHKDWNLNNAFLGSALETLLIDHNEDQIKQAIVIEKIHLALPKKLPAAISWYNLKKYFDLVTENWLNPFLIGVILLKRLLKTPAKPLQRQQVLVFADRHLLTDAAKLLQLLLKSKKSIIIGDRVHLWHHLALTKNNISYFNYEAFQLPTESKQEVKKISRFWSEFKTSPSYQQLLTKYHLTSISQTLTAKLDAFFYSQVSTILNHLSKAQSIIAKVKPKKILIFSNHGFRSLSFAFAALNQGAKVFVLQHGLMFLPNPVYTLVLDRLLVWGEIEKYVHTKIYNLPANKTKLVGWYYADNLVDPSKLYRQKQINQSLKSSHVKILLVTAVNSSAYNSQMKIIHNVIEAVAALENSCLTIRPHPGQYFPKDLVKLAPQHFQSKIYWDFGRDLDSQLKAADIIITQATTVGLRAMLWGKPIIHLALYETVDIAQFSKYGAAVRVEAIKKLLPTIKKIINNLQFRTKMIKAQEKLLRDYAYQLDAKSSERVANLLLN